MAKIAGTASDGGKCRPEWCRPIFGSLSVSGRGADPAFGEFRTTTNGTAWKLSVKHLRLMQICFTLDPGTQPVPISNFSATVLLTICCLCSSMCAQQKKAESVEYATVRGIPYREGTDLTDYMKERCHLEIYYPKNVKEFSTVVWFHGGGLKNGKGSVPEQLEEQGIAVVAVNYRLHPKVKSPAYVEDAAAAVAWTIRNVSSYGGDANRVFVSGHSAGGYLTSMIGLDRRWLGAFDIDADQIAGLIPFSGHTITHFTVRAERGIDGKQPIIDDMAPLYHVRKDAPPLLLITGDRDLELLGRYEENAYLWRMMQVVGHPDTDIHELEGFNHGQMAEPAHPLLVRFIRKHSGKQR